VFKKLLQSAISVAITPVAVVADIVTMGGICTDQEKPYTLQTLGNAWDKAKEAVEEDE
jgi:hypothetical protein